MLEQTGFDRFRDLSPVEPEDLVGLWRGRGIPTGHPLDGILENLGWFGKRFTEDLRADALLFRSGKRRLTAIDPFPIPLRLAMRFHSLGKTRFAPNLFSHLLRPLRALGPIATVRRLPFEGVSSAAMVYDRLPITDHFRRMDKDTVIGLMAIKGDARHYLFELQRVQDAAVEQR
ncbi:DUF4334 domain-containing protein (plasmid) [Rhizobium rosettiformans]|uniref:DUF4334 domain-containing protein n=1 Tax=Rhizobium rosettiformans TaxID=1368430 RepID=A0ABX7F213_9HYPH|nr:DUF4334 domain-containing protein [Rhizobium rosettiformans]QRF54493.1 DUF4334 domain-containing protein [Rhizobium rosettiformans]